MKIINILIFGVIFLNVGKSNCQTKCDLQDLSFLIGLMNDYGGKIYIPQHHQKKYFITDFYFNQKKSYDTFISALKTSNFDITKFESLKDTLENSANSISIFSKRYYKYFNNYYSFKRKDYNYIDEDDEEYVLYVGFLKANKFKTTKEKLLFLKGAFVRNGRIDSRGNYVYSFGNSLSKYKVVYKFLRKTGSKIISYSNNKNTTPSTQKIVFIPCDNFKIMLDRM